MNRNFNFNLPKAWLFSATLDQLQVMEPVSIPFYPGVSVADKVYLTDALTGMVYAEADVTGVKDDRIELMVFDTLMETPFLYLDQLKKQDFIPQEFTEGFIPLSVQAYVNLHMAFKDPEHYDVDDITDNVQLQEAVLLSFKVEEDDCGNIFAETYPGAKVGDTVFLLDENNFRIEKEAQVEDVDDGHVRLSILWEAEDRPDLHINTLAKQGHIPSDYVLDPIRLPQASAIAIHSLIRN